MKNSKTYITESAARTYDECVNRAANQAFSVYMGGENTFNMGIAADWIGFVFNVDPEQVLSKIKAEFVNAVR